MEKAKGGPRRCAGARRAAWLLAAAVVGAGAASAPATAQQAAVQAGSVPTPDERTALKLLWSTMAAIDQANRTGNYSVLRDLGSTGFQSQNNPATLGEVFAEVRTRRLDLAETFLVTPVGEIAPRMIDPRTMRMRGRFPMRPTAIAFDLIFTWEGGWRLHGVAVQPQAP